MPNLFLFFTVTLFSLFSFSTQAQVQGAVSSWDSVKAELEHLSEVSPQAFSTELDRTRKKFELTFDHKLDSCLSRDKARPNKKCLDEAKEWRQKYLKLILEARQSFLDKIREERLTEMKKAYDEAVSQLEGESWYKKNPFAK